MTLCFHRDAELGFNVCGVCGFENFKRAVFCNVCGEAVTVSVADIRGADSVPSTTEGSKQPPLRSNSSSATVSGVAFEHKSLQRKSTVEIVLAVEQKRASVRQQRAKCVLAQC